MRRAFTLIELLVVIAIIAILAAILFPVFAQAKAAAKASASLSNAKQTDLAMIMYQGDYDDTCVLGTAWNTGSDPLCFGGNPCMSTWVWLVQPYMKNGDIMVDPLGPTMVVPSGWPRAVAASLNATYGYNVAALCPYYVSTGSTPTQHAISATAPLAPADTVMLVANYSKTEWTYGGAGNISLGWSFNAAPYDNGPCLNVTIDPPDCYSIPAWCIDNWGNNGWWQSHLSNNVPAGAHTGGESMRAANGGILAFLDGHAKKLQPGAAAQGTNWSTVLNASQLVVTDINKYLWDAK
jgi:prepilin-type N-terminal cleavage/methylation domain-containing protein